MRSLAAAAAAGLGGLGGLGDGCGGLGGDGGTAGGPVLLPVGALALDGAVADEAARPAPRVLPRRPRRAAPVALLRQRRALVPRLRL